VATRYRSRRASGSHALAWIALAMVGVGLIVCLLGYAALRRLGSPPSTRDVTLTIAYSPEKEEVFQRLAQAFTETRPRLENGKRVQVVVTRVNPDAMVEGAQTNAYDAISPDSSIWLGEIERRGGASDPVGQSIVGETVRYMVSPVVIGMWRDVATTLGYPDSDLGWQDLLQAAADNPEFPWSHPSTSSASGLLTTLALFYAGAGTTRGMTEADATAQTTIDYVTRLERTVTHYGEGELAVMQQIEAQGRAYLDAFVVQEQLLVQYNRAHGPELVAIYPIEGTLWEDHPLALLEHPERTDEERQAFGLLKAFLLSPETQRLILSYGYRPTDLSIRLDGPDSPITPQNGADPAQPYTTLQVPSPSVIDVVRNAWQYTKRRTNIYLVVDVSGSMAGAKLADAQEALRIFVAQIQNADERVGLIAFSSDVDEAVPLTRLGTGRDTLNGAIDTLTASGGTALLDGIDSAATKLQDLNDAERINAIVVMTDGQENRSRASLRAVTARLQRTQGTDTPIVVFCIAYGRDADMEMLEAISNATGGFTQRGELETIRELYRTLSMYF
jgi:Ca-activated chloride channel family protein